MGGFNQCASPNKGAPAFCFKVRTEAGSCFWNTGTLRFRPFSGLKPFTDLTAPSTLSTPHTILLSEGVYSLHVLQPFLLEPWRPRWPPRSRRCRVLSPVQGFWWAHPAPETPVPPSASVFTSPQTFPWSLVAGGDLSQPRDTRGSSASNTSRWNLALAGRSVLFSLLLCK